MCSRFSWTKHACLGTNESILKASPCGVFCFGLQVSGETPASAVGMPRGKIQNEGATHVTEWAQPPLSLHPERPLQIGVPERATTILWTQGAQCPESCVKLIPCVSWEGWVAELRILLGVVWLAMAPGSTLSTAHWGQAGVRQSGVREVVWAKGLNA